MAKVFSEGKLPKRIDDFIIYNLNGQNIIRAISGFTSKALKNAPKYELSRQNASEFGRVSSLCKQLRVALYGILPKKNNLLVVNTLTKKMREVMVCDTKSARGARNLALALRQEAGKLLLQDYHFNPEGAVALDYELEETILNLTTTNISFPEGSNAVGSRLHCLAFDFNTGNSVLESDSWAFFGKLGLPSNLQMPLPKMPTKMGVAFLLLELRFYVAAGGSYLPLEDDSSTVLCVLDVG